MKAVWGKGTPWKNEAAFWTWLRGGLRRAVWQRHPVKLSYKNSKRFKAPLGKNGKEVFAIRCEMCDNVFKQSEVEVDHIFPAGSLKEVGDIAGFVQRLALVTPQDLRLLCKWCHGIVSYAERYDVTLEQARKRKEEIRDGLAKKRQNSKERKRKTRRGKKEKE